jgi:hypothetical protein
MKDEMPTDRQRCAATYAPVATNVKSPEGALHTSEGFSPEGALHTSEGFSPEGAFHTSEGFSPEGAFHTSEGRSPSFAHVEDIEP